MESDQKVLRNLNELLEQKNSEILALKDQIHALQETISSLKKQNEELIGNQQFNPMHIIQNNFWKCLPVVMVMPIVAIYWLKMK